MADENKDGLPNLSEGKDGVSETDKKGTENKGEGNPPADKSGTDAADALKLTPTEPDLDAMDMEGLMLHSGFTPERRAEAAKHFKEHGKLSDADYADLKGKAKIPKAVANRMMQLEMGEAQRSHQTRQESVNAAVTEAKKIAGGEDEYKNLLSWATTGGIEKTRLERFDKMIKTDPGMYPEIVKTLASEHAAAHKGSSSKPGFTPAPNTGKPKNKAEYSTLMAKVVNGDKDAEKILDGMELSEIMKLPV